jgi:hypothetical protein
MHVLCEDDHRKRPQPIDPPKKLDGILERCEAGTDDDHDHRRHLRTRISTRRGAETARLE